MRRIGDIVIRLGWHDLNWKFKISTNNNGISSKYFYNYCQKKVLTKLPATANGLLTFWVSFLLSASLMSIRPTKKIYKFKMRKLPTLTKENYRILLFKLELETYIFYWWLKSTMDQLNFFSQRKQGPVEDLIPISLKQNFLK